MNWEAVAVIAGSFGVAQSVTLFVVRAIVREEIAKLNGTYIRRGECTLMHDETQRRLERLEDTQ